MSDTLPYRFKAGIQRRSDMGGVSVQSVHHHRSTTKQEHRPFKSKHASNRALKDAAKGKVEAVGRGQPKSLHQQQVLSKLQRRNQAKQLRVNHKAKIAHELDIFRGLDGAPKQIAVIPLFEDVDPRRCINNLLTSVDHAPDLLSSGLVEARIDRYARNILFMPSTMDMLTALDICKLADHIIFVLKDDQTIDPAADNLLRVIEGQGVTDVVFAVQRAGDNSAAKTGRTSAELEAQVRVYFASTERILDLSSVTDCSLTMRKICTTASKGIKWRDTRSWMLIEASSWGVEEVSNKSEVQIQGVIRGKNLNPDRLVHIPGWGEYQIGSIQEAPKRAPKRKADEMNDEHEVKRYVPTPEQDEIADLAPELVDMTGADRTASHEQHKGVLLDDHYYFSDDESHIPQRPAKLPVGTSTYQSAWYLDNVSDSDEDDIDQALPDADPSDLVTEQKPEDGISKENLDDMTDTAATEYPESTMHVDKDEEDEAIELAEYRQSSKKEAEEDLEFPDEIELPPEALARDRLSKYRGLKSLRTSTWNTAYDTVHQPSITSRLLQVPDYKKSYNAAVKESLAGGVPAGTRVIITLRAVPNAFKSLSPPSSLFSLLRHEHKQTVMNINFTLASHLDAPIRSKDELVVQIGHRRLAINPIFSAGGVTPNHVHKFDRYLHPGQTAVATYIGPLTWGSVPCLVFRRHATSDSSSSGLGLAPAVLPSSELELIGTATTLPPSTISSRIIAKRIILTGHPYKIHKNLVTVRYMFFNRTDVEWFKALPLWTKRGRQGFIKEPLGTHGYFKATFDGKINALDAIGVSLYKRVWPRESRMLA